MVFLVGFAEFWIGHVGVDLCRRDACVSEHFLDGAYVGTIGQQGRREGVTKGMGRDIFDDIGTQSIGFDHRRDMDAGESKARRIVGVEISRIDIMSDEERWNVVATCLDILGDSVARTVREIDDAHPSTLTTHAKLPTREVDTRTIECTELGDTQTRRVDTLDDGTIAHPLDRPRVDRREYPLDLLGREEGHLTFFLFHEVDHDGVEAGDTFFACVLEKRPKRDHISIACAHRSSALVERQSKLIRILDLQVLDGERTRLGEVLDGSTTVHASLHILRSLAKNLLRIEDSTIMLRECRREECEKCPDMSSILLDRSFARAAPESQSEDEVREKANRIHTREKLDLKFVRRLSLPYIGGGLLYDLDPTENHQEEYPDKKRRDPESGDRLRECVGICHPPEDGDDERIDESSDEALCGEYRRAHIRRRESVDDILHHGRADTTDELSNQTKRKARDDDNIPHKEVASGDEEEKHADGDLESEESLDRVGIPR